MKKAIFVIITVFIIISVFVVSFFLDDLEKREKGLGYEYYNVIDVDVSVKYGHKNVLGFNYGNYASLCEIFGNTYAVAVDFDEEFYIGDDDFSNVKIYISRYTETVTTPTTNVLTWTGEPIVLSCTGYPYATNEANYFFVKTIEVDVNASTFLGIINNNIDVADLNSMKWDDVENIIDFSIFIFDIIRYYICLLIDIIVDMGVFFT